MQVNINRDVAVVGVGDLVFTVVLTSPPMLGRTHARPLARAGNSMVQPMAMAGS
jgi:hypothetical protein